MLRFREQARGQCSCGLALEELARLAQSMDVREWSRRDSVGRRLFNAVDLVDRARDGVRAALGVFCNLLGQARCARHANLAGLSFLRNLSALPSANTGRVSVDPVALANWAHSGRQARAALRAASGDVAQRAAEA